MFDVHAVSSDEQNESLVALPHEAMRCLRSCMSADHARAEGLRHGHQKRHDPRLHVASLRAELHVRELAKEAR